LHNYLKTYIGQQEATKQRI